MQRDMNMGTDAARVTTSLSRSQKTDLERIANKRGVKIAWLVRHAVDRFLEQEQGGPMLPLGRDDRGGDRHG